MAKKTYWDVVPRRPRHTVGGALASLALVRGPTHTPREVSAELQDLSRQGACVRLCDLIGADEPVEFRLEVGADGCLTAAACVKWVRAEPQGGWLAGLLFDEALPYEVMGELFLAGVLSTGASD